MVDRINVLVASTVTDVKAEVLAECVAARSDMNLIGGHFIPVSEVETSLASVPSTFPCALIVVGEPIQTSELAEQWLAKRADCVVMLVDVVDDIVRVALRDPKLDSLLTALRGLVERIDGGTGVGERVVRVKLPVPVSPVDRPLLTASIKWLHALLRDAVANTPTDNGDLSGFSVTRTTLLHALDDAADPGARDQTSQLTAANSVLEAAFDAALASNEPTAEPLARAARALSLSPLDFRILVLGLAPEIDLRFQRCIGFLLDDMGRRAGTFALFETLLGRSPEIRPELADSGAVDRWQLFESSGGQRAAADETLRIDPHLARWLLGESDAIAGDPRIRRVVRLDAWPGASLLKRPSERHQAAQIFERFREPNAPQWVVLNRDDPPGWRALIELGAAERQTIPIRVEATRLSGLDAVEIEETARRLIRCAHLTQRPLVVDIVGAEQSEGHESLRVFFAAMSYLGGHALAICGDEARIVTLIGPAPFHLIDEESLSIDARTDAVRTAAERAEVYLDDESACAFAARFPLRIDALEEATNLARSRPLDVTADDPRRSRFSTACKELVAEGISPLVDRLEPPFDLDDVVLPPDRKSQLVEVVDNVRFAHRVLDEWRFGERLPYGRGVSALFVGPSGTGKTMAAMAIARRLNIQILRLDLSKVVSKYIGDTEKNIDRVFTDSQRSGAAILIDEADALLGKRSEVKDSHDRYANIEVAFLLQRMEEYNGLAILTSNMRQSLDPAFVRRLRFIVDFPRPDAEARERIWRQCLPVESHSLNDAAFRQLARKVDVTGGNIRQITLRAAFIAAAAGSLITLVQVVQATRAELAKLGMPGVDIDVSAARQAA